GRDAGAAADDDGAAHTGGSSGGAAAGSGGTAEKEPPASGGGAKFRNASTGGCITAPGGNAPYANAYSGDCSGEDTSWTTRGTSGGAFRIVRAGTTNCLTDGGVASATTCGSRGGQEWRQVSDGTLRSAESGECLAAAKFSGNVYTQACDGGTDQQWSRV
ncbi:MAG TPA: RICIN domain-containing protein, partial [Streptomyces sp.]|nr:RICIN domain-containing protein [Streptomyces sp.]